MHSVASLLAPGQVLSKSGSARWTEGGTHSGPLQTPGGTIPPTGKQIAMAGTSTLRVTGGKITEEHVEADIAGLMQHLGVMGREP